MTTDGPGGPASAKGFLYLSFPVEKRLHLVLDLSRSYEIRGQFVRGSDARLKSQ